MSFAEDEGYDAYDGEEIAPSIYYVKGIWTDAEGNNHQIKDMGISYIKNCINVLEKTKTEWDYFPEDLGQINKKIAEFKKELIKRTKFKEKF